MNSLIACTSQSGSGACPSRPTTARSRSVVTSGAPPRSRERNASRANLLASPPSRTSSSWRETAPAGATDGRRERRTAPVKQMEVAMKTYRRILPLASVATSPNALNSCASGSAFEGDDLDKTLIAAIARGDQTAFRELHARYYHRIARFARASTDRCDRVDEIINDTLWVIWQSAARFKGEAKVSTWIMGITRNISLNALRAIRRNHSSASDALEEQAHEPSLQSELSEWVHKALERLPSEQRTTLEMFYRLGES